MELRVLRYFLAVAREEGITAAAEALHVTQPTLSRQLKELEDELGKPLLVRGAKKITLTDEGRLLRQRAQEIIDLTDKTRSEIISADTEVSGDVYIGGGETEVMRFIAKTVRVLQKTYPRIRTHLFSGNGVDVLERLDKGLLDFGVLVSPSDIAAYNFIQLPQRDIRGLLMRKDSPLASRAYITPQDFDGIPVIASRNEAAHRAMTGWLGKAFESLNIVATFNLIFNAALLVEEGVGYALSLDGLEKVSDESALCFRPLEPRLEVNICLVWKKQHVFSKASEKFLAGMRELL